MIKIYFNDTNKKIKYLNVLKRTIIEMLIFERIMNFDKFRDFYIVQIMVNRND